MDVSNFDKVFTSDKSWKHSTLLFAKTDHASVGEDPFANFHYVARPSMDRKREFASGTGATGSRPLGRAPTVRYDVMEKGRRSIENFRDRPRTSDASESDIALMQRSSSEPLSEDALQQRNSLGRRNSSIDGGVDEETGKGPCSPWHPCDNGHVKVRGKKRRGARASREFQPREMTGVDLPKSRDSRNSDESDVRERISFDELGHSSEEEDQVEGEGGAHHSSHVSTAQMRTYQSNIPIAKAGYLLSAKKAVTAATYYSKKRYVSSKRKFMRLIPSLGCLAVFKSETSLVPSKVLAVPSAEKIYPKHGIIHIGSQVHVHSIRVLTNKEYTFICDSELERDDWVEQLRTVGEHWANSCMRHLQLCKCVKTWKTRGLFKKLFSSEPTDRFEWEAEMSDGKTMEMVSMLGVDDEGKYRYDGMVKARATGDKVRHGRGLCHWKLSPEEKERERERPRTAMRHAYYDGFWEHSSKSGQAMIKFADDSLFEGIFKNPTGAQGYGRMAYVDGSWYEGEWHDGMKHGYGYMWWLGSNEAHQGMFAKDMPHGHGIRYYPSGEVYQGGWFEGAKHGVGLLERLATVQEDDADGAVGRAVSTAGDGACVARAVSSAHAMRRVTSHAHFQLELTDDEEDLSHNSSSAQDDKGADGADLPQRRALVREQSNSSMKGA
jgi:hypothetical protein